MVIKFPIFVYWENKIKGKTPDIIKKCYKIMDEKLNNIIFVDQNNIHNYINNYKLVDCSKIKHIAQKVDYYRSVILYHNGGMWIDSDTIVLRNFNDLIENFISSGLEVGCDTSELNNNVINIQYLIAKKESNIIKKWMLECENIILSNKHFGWSDLGGKLLGSIYNKYFNNQKIFKIPTNFRVTTGYKNYMKYYSTEKKEINDFFNLIKLNQPYTVCLYGTFMYNLNIEKNTLLDELFNYKDF
jgi:hypothetical protein